MITSSSPVNSNGSQMEMFQHEIVKFKSQIEDMEKQLRIFEGDLSNLTTLCEVEYQEQILEEVWKRVRMHKQVLEEKYNSLGAPPASQVSLTKTAEVKSYITENPHVQILNFLNSNGLLPARDQEQRVAEILPPTSSTLLDGQKLNLVDHLSPGDDNNVQRPEFGQVIINSNLSPWTEFYQTGIY
uniref:Uncharacterized protein n=1 Tax=Populus trichocarpa TaxID=3694 RepID=A0A2K1XP62_POPTR